MAVHFLDTDTELQVYLNNEIALIYENRTREDGSLYHSLKEGYQEEVSKELFFGLLELKISEIPRGLYFFYFNHEANLEHICFDTTDNNFSYSYELNMRTWSYPFSIESYLQYASELVQNSYQNVEVFDSNDGTGFSISSKINNTQVFPLKDKYLAHKQLIKKINYEVISALSNKSTKNIEKSITFKKEHYKAGITILQNFGSLLTEKYPSGGISFSIKQEGLKVIMTISSPNGEKKVIEDYLNSYGLVITGKIKPEEFTPDPLIIMDLKRQLIQVKSELEWSNEKSLMLSNTINGQDRQIDNLTNQLEYFQNQLTTVLSSQNTSQNNQHIEIKELIVLLKNETKSSDKLIEQFMSSIQKEDIESTKQTLQKLEKTDSSFREKIDNFILTIVASTGANTPAWVDYLNRII
ncbi:hypothetical protein [Thalassomonas haliotis]|uniref:Uncharacterized protein n=1 Tax=Thalassomonas haliotis TaxID=485448 RepID=A0ABY7VAH3_9GAMM|nr:hypothetical protein [Thalassomonas haliotis]WDE10311.1 hypothetical protein H3N35_18800 [Thalassomonas haliotis]